MEHVARLMNRSRASTPSVTLVDYVAGIVAPAAIAAGNRTLSDLTQSKVDPPSMLAHIRR